jgi:hypothetical protein
MISAGRSVDLPSRGSVKKFTGASFFTEMPALLKISKSTSLTRSFYDFKGLDFLGKSTMAKENKAS